MNRAEPVTPVSELRTSRSFGVECSTSVLYSRTGANRDGRNYVTGASQSVGRRRESPSTSAAPPEFTYIVTSTTLRFHGVGAGVTVSLLASARSLSAESGNRSGAGAKAAARRTFSSGE